LPIDHDALGRHFAALYTKRWHTGISKILSGALWPFVSVNRNDAATSWSFRPEQAAAGQVVAARCVSGQKDLPSAGKGSLAPHDCRVFMLTALP